ncbi:hypothetical protein MUP01_10825 [Candidatus Bathyarchaeota archaeon]|nr:hypothetical protein [Candidatus Bathyarchaeota archaeon]
MTEKETLIHMQFKLPSKIMDNFGRKMYEKCVHYQYQHFDNVKGDYPICPHYNHGYCDMYEEHPQVFSEKCVISKEASKP